MWTGRAQTLMAGENSGAWLSSLANTTYLCFVTLPSLFPPGILFWDAEEYLWHLHNPAQQEDPGLEPSSSWSHGGLDIQP